MKIGEYKTVSAASSKELDNAVNRYLKMGFQPFGTPYVAGTGSNAAIYQALVREEGASGHETHGHRTDEPKVILPPPPKPAHS